MRGRRRKCLCCGALFTVLASVLNTSLSTVRQWEIGEKHPSERPVPEAA